MNETDEMVLRYERRKTAGIHARYSPLKPANILVRQERERAICDLLAGWLGDGDLAEARILEVGCGSGANLLQLLSLGAKPEHMMANELLPERVAAAGARLPSAITMLPGDAMKIDVEDSSLDLVVQSTVFSSILDQAFAGELAQKMFAWLRPGGAILWYDFVYDNPSNKDVRGIGLREIRDLFPAARMQTRRVTLAPPIFRRLGPLVNVLYPILNAMPFLRTHVVCLIIKEPSSGSVTTK